MVLAFSGDSKKRRKKVMKIWHTESACSSHLRDWQIIKNAIPKFQRTLNMLEADVIIVYLCGISAMALEANKKEPLARFYYSWCTRE